MNSLIRRVGLLQLLSQQPCYLQQRVQPVFIGSHWQPGNRNVYKRKPKVKTLHYKKAELMAVLNPIRPDPHAGKPMWETCRHVTHPEPDEIPLTKFEEVLTKELYDKLKTSQVVAIVAEEAMSAIDKRRCEVYLGRKKMYLKRYTRRVIQAGLTGTEYENFLPLFDGLTDFLFCKEPTVKEFFSIFHKYPRFVVLAGYTEGRILSRTELEAYAKMPTLDVARAQFVSVLNSASAQLMRTLGTGQSVLVSHLESRAEELKKDSAPGSTAASEGSEAKA